MNSFGQYLRLTTFGESHGPAIGGVLDGFPAGLRVDFEAINRFLARRRPGGTTLGTTRNEADVPEFLSGIFNGVTLGTPIAFIIRNTDCRSEDYDPIKFRPGHADYTYHARYGIRDHRGGGRASARETACRLVAAALALQILEPKGITIRAGISQIGDISLPKPVSATDPHIAEAIETARHEKETLGGIISCTINGLTAGLGEPVYGKFSAKLAEAMLSINAAHGFEYGMGYDGCCRPGSSVVDPFDVDNRGRVITTANNSGGIQGGITNGMPVTFRVAFKPVATMPGRPLQTVDAYLNRCTINAVGRHDPCVLPRAIPVVEAMAALTTLDALLAPSPRL